MSKRYGFTVVEIILVITLLGLLGVVLAPGLSNMVRTFNLVSNRKAALGQVRSGLERMVRETRLIPGVAQILTIGATQFQFEYPVGTTINYNLSGTTLQRGTSALIDNVTSFSMTYYDQLGAVTATVANVRSVGITLTVDPPGSIPTYTVRTRVFLRNTSTSYASYTSP